MGALHAGHRSLIRAARNGGSDIVIVSIYVNPLQFGPNEDLAKYPRPREADLAACDAEGVDLVLYLQDADMVPKGFATFVEVAGLGDHLCGASRPGHFRGVTTIVTKLFHLARPHAAWFGQKDAQQALSHCASPITNDPTAPRLAAAASDKRPKMRNLSLALSGCASSQKPSASKP
jgi:pantoate--beta-alanine ligase